MFTPKSLNLNLSITGSLPHHGWFGDPPGSGLGSGITSVNNSLPLYISGAAIPISGTAPLFCRGAGAGVVSGVVPLHLHGGSTASGQMILFCKGGNPLASGLTLFTHGGSSVSGSIPLFTKGPFATSASMPLYVKAGEPTPASGNVSLFVYGGHTSGTGLFKSIPLVIPSGDNSLPASLNLFVNATGPQSLCGSMPLFVGAVAPNAIGTVPLFVCNHQSGVVGQLPLFVQGSGVGPGGVPVDASMNLFLRRGASQAIPLYVRTDGNPVSSGVSLMTHGFGSLSGIVNLAIPHAIGSISRSTSLFTSGW